MTSTVANVSNDLQVNLIDSSSVHALTASQLSSSNILLQGKCRNQQSEETKASSVLIGSPKSNNRQLQNHRLQHHSETMDVLSRLQKNNRSKISKKGSRMRNNIKTMHSRENCPKKSSKNSIHVLSQSFSSCVVSKNDVNVFSKNINTNMQKQEQQPKYESLSTEKKIGEIKNEQNDSKKKMGRESEPSDKSVIRKEEIARPEEVSKSVIMQAPPPRRMTTSSQKSAINLNEFIMSTSTDLQQHPLSYLSKLKGEYEVSPTISCNVPAFEPQKCTTISCNETEMPSVTDKESFDNFFEEKMKNGICENADFMKKKKNQLLTRVKSQQRRINRRSKSSKREAARRRKKNQRKSFTQNFKTEICRSHQMLGYCEYENLCQFAHGMNELLPRQFGLKYKTEECKNYHTDGHCRFGSRCKFIHDEKRVKISGNEFWLVSQKENIIRVEVVENELRKAELDALTKTQDDVTAFHKELRGEDEKMPGQLKDSGLWASLKGKNNPITTANALSFPARPVNDHTSLSTELLPPISNYHLLDDNNAQSDTPLATPHTASTLTPIDTSQCMNHYVYPQSSSQSPETQNNVQQGSISKVSRDSPSGSSYQSNRSRESSNETPMDIMRPDALIHEQTTNRNGVRYSSIPIVMDSEGKRRYLEHNMDIGPFSFDDTQCLVTPDQTNNYDALCSEGRKFVVFDRSKEAHGITNAPYGTVAEYYTDPSLNCGDMNNVFTRSQYEQFLLNQHNQEYLQQVRNNYNTFVPTGIQGKGDVHLTPEQYAGWCQIQQLQQLQQNEVYNQLSY